MFLYMLVSTWWTIGVHVVDPALRGLCSPLRVDHSSRLEEPLPAPYLQPQLSHCANTGVAERNHCFRRPLPLECSHLQHPGVSTHSTRVLEVSPPEYQKHHHPGICALRKLGHRAPKPVPKNYCPHLQRDLNQAIGTGFRESLKRLSLLTIVLIGARASP